MMLADKSISFTIFTTLSVFTRSHYSSLVIKNKIISVRDISYVLVPIVLS